MAEVTGMRNNALPYPVYGLPYTFVFPVFDADGDLVTGGTADTPDSELSKNGDTFTDCTEAVEIATTSGMYYIPLTATEMECNVGALIFKTATAGTKTTPIVFYPVRLPVIADSQSTAGAAATITLAAGSSAIDDYYNGCIIYLNADTGAGQARMILDYDGGTLVATVQAWATEPDATTDYIIYRTEFSVLEKVYLDASVAGIPTTPTLQATWTDALATALASYTAVRAGYIDELAAANLPTDIAAITAAGPTKDEMDTAHAL